MALRHTLPSPLPQEVVKDSGVVLFFYPRANTPGCTKQACGFRDEHQKFLDAGFKVFGMSADKPKSQLNWKNKHSLPYSFLCDPDYKVRAGAWGRAPAGGAGWPLPPGLLHPHTAPAPPPRLLPLPSGRCCRGWACPAAARSPARTS